MIALAARAGSLVNLPLSYVWTRVAGDVSGVIWGTVLTTWVSNLLVPALYCAHVLKIAPGVFLRRTLGAPLVGAAVLVAVALLTRGIVADGAIDGGTRLQRATPLVIHLAIGVGAYMLGYLLTPTGKADLQGLLDRIRRRAGRH